MCREEREFSRFVQLVIDSTRNSKDFDLSTVYQRYRIDFFYSFIFLNISSFFFPIVMSLYIMSVFFLPSFLCFYLS